MKAQSHPVLAAALTSGMLLHGTHAAVAPYAVADADTSYLFHFDEAAGSSVADNLGSAGFDAIACSGGAFADGVAQPANTTLLGAAGYSGFGNAANVTGNALFGIDADGNGSFLASDGAPITGTDQLPDHSTVFGTGNAFTLEALVNLPSITSGNRELICTDNNGVAADRGFQWRITGTGNLEFNFIGSAPAAFIAPIPTAAENPNAFAANTWFHVALTYDGTTLTYYWTKVDPSATAAVPFATNAAETVDINDDALLIIGNEGRATGGLGGEPVGGLIDEVRISKVARTPSQFIFKDTADSDGDGMLDGWETTHFGNLSQGPAGDFDSDSFSNLAEFNAGSNPNDNLSVPGDTDADGLSDSWETTNFGNLGQTGGGDPDNDFAINEDEETAGSNPTLKSSFPDAEKDGLGDAWELFHFGDTTSQTAAGDPDADLYTNAEEFTAGTDPNVQLSAPDSDADGLSDGWEALHFFAAGNDRATVLAKQSGAGDADGDGYTNDQEETAGTNPKTAERPSDLDGDGLVDSWELFHFSSLDEIASGNPDGDAGNNLQEQNAGSNPALAASVPTDIDGDSVPDSAEFFRPYTADSNTLHLWHLDEADQPAADAGNSPLALTALNLNGRMWAPSLAGFGTGLDPSTGRGTADGGILSALTLANGVADDTTLAYAGADGAFTFEAIVRTDFDPAVAPASVATMQILSGEADTGATRAWQFRIVPVGGPGNLAGTGPLLEFININGEVAVQSLAAPLPAGTDPDAIVQGGWYHVAVAYNGSEATASNLKFYWTRLDPSRTQAKEIFSGQMNLDLPLTTPDFAIGNEARATGGSSEAFAGVVDEVRISSVARAPGQFLFTGGGNDSDGDGLDDTWETTYFGDLSQGAAGDFDRDGTDNLTEFRLGLIPNSGTSRFAATPDSAAGSLQWPSAAGTTFKIERSVNLAAWTTLQAAYPGSAGTTSYTDPAPPAGKAFYRVTLNP
jgi:hypothetical protein